MIHSRAPWRTAGRGGTRAFLRGASRLHLVPSARLAAETLRMFLSAESGAEAPHPPVADPSLCASVVRLASEHGVLGLAGPLLSRWAPPGSRAGVDRRLRFETLRNFALAQELLEALRLLASHGIPALAWKGPGLAAALYGSFVCRSPADLDVLVEGAAATRAREILCASGLYVADSPEGSARHCVLRNPGAGICLELQSDLAARWGLAARGGGSAFDFSGLWRRRMMISLGGGQVACPGFQDLAVLLAVHGARHRWNRWIWVCDMGQLLQHDAVDWTQAWAEASQAGAARRLSLAVCLAGDLLGKPVPQVLAEAASQPVVTSLASYASRQLLDPDYRPRSVRADLNDFAFSAGVLDRASARWSATVSFLRNRCLGRPSSPSPAAPCSSLILRPYRLLRRYGLRAALRFVRTGCAVLSGLPALLSRSLDVEGA